MMINNNINNKNLPPAGPSSPIRKFDSPIRAAGTPSVNHFQQQQPRMIISSNSPASVLRSPILSSAQQQQQQQQSNHRPISPIANQLLQGNYQNNNIRMKSPIISSSSNKNNAIPPSSVAASLILKRAALLHSHYAPRSELGRGSFGVVYLCSVTTLGFSRLLASPCMSAASSASTSSSQNSSSLSPAIPTEVVVKTVILPPDDGKMKEMAIQEVSTLMKLRHHNKVVNVLDAWIESGSLFGINNNNNNNNIRGNGNHHNRLSPISHSRSPSFQQEKPDQVLCIALEYCSGGTLDEFITKNIKGMPGACPASTVISVATQIFIGLDFMHRQLHLIHRDIKPANIFLRNNNKKNNGTSAASPLDLVLGDFGISRTLESTYAMAQTRTGTPFWLAPEIPTDQSYSFPVDVWAVGVIMYEMMLGSRPFILSSSSSSPSSPTPAGVPNNNRHPNNNNHNHHHHPLALLNRIVNHDPMPNLVQVCAKFYPVELLDLVRGCLEKEPSRRPSANVALEILSGICSKYGYQDEVQNNNNNYFKNNNNSRPTSPVVAGIVGNNNNKQQRSPSPVVLSSAISRNNININNNDNNKIISSNSLSPNNNNQGCRAPNVTPAFGSPCFVVSSNEKRSPSLSNNIQNKNEAAAAAGDDESREDSSIKAMNENNRRNNVAFVAAVNNNNNNNNSPSSSVTPFLRFSSSVASYVDFCIFSPPSSSSSSPSSEKKTFKSSSARRLHDGVGIPGCIALAVLKTTQYQVHVLQKQKQNNQNEEDSSSSSFSNSKNNFSSFKFSFSPMLVRSALSMLCLSDGGTMSYLRNADGDSLGRVCVWANEVFI